MPKLGPLIIIIALAAGFYTLWQSQSETTIGDMPAVIAVTIDAEGALIIHGEFAQDCADSPQTIVRSFANNLDIQLSRERSSLAACSLQAAPFAVELPAASSPYVIINDQVWSRGTDDAGADISYEAHSLFPVHIEEARLAISESGEMLLTVRGIQAFGCDLPELFSLRKANGRVLIGVFNALAADVGCPDMPVEVDEVFTLPATELPVDTLFAVNNFLIEGLEAIDVNDSDKVLTNIMRVDVNAQQAQISLEVEGEHPDGCDLPVHVEQSRAGNIVNVEVYREVPVDMICPMILRPYQGKIQLNGEFESGSYTINVNSHSQTLDI